MLRATLMNPYIHPYITDRNVDFIGLFMYSLHETTMEIIIIHNSVYYFNISNCAKRVHD